MVARGTSARPWAGHRRAHSAGPQAGLGVDQVQQDVETVMGTSAGNGVRWELRRGPDKTSKNSGVQKTAKPDIVVFYPHVAHWGQDSYYPHFIDGGTEVQSSSVPHPGSCTSPAVVHDCDKSV